MSISPGGKCWLSSGSVEKETQRKAFGSDRSAAGWTVHPPGRTHTSTACTGVAKAAQGKTRRVETCASAHYSRGVGTLAGAGVWVGCRWGGRWVRGRRGCWYERGHGLALDWTLPWSGVRVSVLAAWPPRIGCTFPLGWGAIETHSETWRVLFPGRGRATPLSLSGSLSGAHPPGCREGGQVAGCRGLCLVQGCGCRGLCPGGCLSQGSRSR